MLEHSVYSVISPEGCASILWRSADKVSDACQAMKMTAREIKQLGVVEEVIEEPLGGAHHDYDFAAQKAKEGVIKHVAELSRLSRKEVRLDRQNKFRNIGSFVEATVAR
jgi:acetyl-CoA carboxylase carboxyl transferase subunit alpha